MDVILLLSAADVDGQARAHALALGVIPAVLGCLAGGLIGFAARPWWVSLLLGLVPPVVAAVWYWSTWEPRASWFAGPALAASTSAAKGWFVGFLVVGIPRAWNAYRQRWYQRWADRPNT